MTKKRFTYKNHKVKDNKTGEVHSSNMVSVNVLNELNDENEQLKESIYSWSQSYNRIYEKNEQLEKRLQIYKSDGLETLEKLQRCYKNSKKAMKTIDALDEENEQLKQDWLYWSQTAEARRKEIDKLRKDNNILKQQRDYLFDVIDEVLPHSGSTTAYNRMKDIGDVE